MKAYLLALCLLLSPLPYALGDEATDSVRSRMLENVEIRSGEPLPRYGKVIAAQLRIRTGYDGCLDHVASLQRDQEVDRKIASGEANLPKPGNYVPPEQRKQEIAREAKETKALIAPQRERLATPKASKELSPEKIAEMLKFLEITELELTKLEKL